MTSQNQRYFAPAKNILLTGAGFTRPFGGYLASEMWAAILNQPEVRENGKLRRHMLEELNYETVYDTVLTSNAYRSVKHAFRIAIHRAYHQMHEIIFREGNLKHQSTVSRMFQSFISRFARSENERAFFFTLNHDLLVEQFYVEDKSLLRIPGVPHCPRWFKRQLVPSLDQASRVQLPGENTVKEKKAQFWDKSAGQPFVYIKLHGSYGWYAKNGEDVMVIGHSKTKIINNEPLLRWYLSLFKEVLREPERNLLVIGYGFGDEHINNVIADAIKDCGLRLYVVSPKQPRDFREMLVPVNSFVERFTPRGDDLWQGLFGYYRASVTDIYQEDSLQLKPLGQALIHDLNLI